MRKPVIAGNWKMHKVTAEARALAGAIRDGAAGVTHCEVVLAPPFTALQAVGAELGVCPIQVAAQNVHWEAKGAYTGEVSIGMLVDAGCQKVIIGHSERRQYFGETDETVNRRVRALLQSPLGAIVCIGETLLEREAGKHHQVIAQQLTGGLHGLTVEDLSHIIIAYEPVWAIGTGRTASPEIAQETHSAIRSWFIAQYGAEAAQEVRILYGGSVKPDNIADLMRQPDIDGALVGGACLEAESFLRIIHYRS